MCAGLSSDLSNISQSLLGKGFIAAERMAQVLQVPGTNMQKANILYIELLEGVKTYRSRYSGFISVLEENRALHGDLLTALRNTHLKICKYI